MPASGQPSRFAMQGCDKRFGATVALAGVDLEVAPGEVCGLVGENGAGKSTLMKVLAGALQPDAGTMVLDGQPYAPRTPADGRRAGVAMIYQELSLAPHLSVMENVMLGVEPRRGLLLDWPRMRARASDALSQVGRADIPLDRRTRELSLADRQLVEIARSVAFGSRVLVLDEPTSSLTQRDVERLFALVRRLKAEGCAIVYISHFLEEVRAITDRFIVLRDGRSVGSGETAATGIDRLVALMVGRAVEDLYPRSPRTPGEVALRLDGLCGVRKPEDASLELRRGEVLGIAGLVGAGRTELLRAVFGLDPIASGRVRVGAAEGPARPRTRWSQGVGFVSEDRKTEGLALGLSVAENVALPRLSALSRFGFVTPRAQAAAATPWIDELAIRCRSPNQRVSDLSGGNQQKVALARLLSADVDVLLLDEPTRGIDIASRAQIYRLIDELAGGDAARGIGQKAILLVSSYLPELLGVCDRIAVMCRGRLGPARPVADIDAREIMLEATGADV